MKCSRRCVFSRVLCGTWGVLGCGSVLGGLFFNGVCAGCLWDVWDEVFAAVCFLWCVGGLFVECEG
jgi:hypothetical protein